MSEVFIILKGKSHRHRAYHNARRVANEYELDCGMTSKRGWREVDMEWIERHEYHLCGNCSGEAIHHTGNGKWHDLVRRIEAGELS